ncbi:MAG: 30S ribosomal protein S12 methylthiotransferase RimO [Clostridia bacterium]|nr:30S ribosomal protein S12 methylthiotransferase RimO [Clostridia bacterium]
MTLKKEDDFEVTNVDTIKVNKRRTRNMLVGMVSLGCDKNRVDGEIMLTYLRDAGYKFTSDASKADILIVNTCGFIKSARDESMETINEMSEYRTDPKARCQRLVVTGCLPQKWSNDIRSEFPAVDIFLGINQYADIVNILQTSLESNKKILKVTNNSGFIPYVKDRVVTTPPHYAYLKIADGCNNFCTFCTIPSIRGRYRSRSMEDILDEAKNLVENGARELILVAQDVSRYGIDKSGKPMLVKLIQKLSKIEKLKWIRLLYCYPEMIGDDLLNEMVNNDKLCKYIDIPLQHVSNNVLKRMNRHTNNKDIVTLIERIKSLPAFVAIRTTFMTGFPGETEENFKELCDFIEKNKLMHVGFFAYSKEKDTPAADFKDQIPEKVKKSRVLTLMKIQSKVVAENNKKFIGKTLEVCYEGIDYDKQLFFGRCEYQTPEADTLVFFKSKFPIEIGKFYKVKITKVRGYDLQGEIVND